MKRMLKSLLSSVIIGSMLLSSVSSVFANQVVKVSIGSTVANVNGNNTTLSVAPYKVRFASKLSLPDSAFLSPAAPAIAFSAFMPEPLKSTPI